MEPPSIWAPPQPVPTPPVRPRAGFSKPEQAIAFALALLLVLSLQVLLDAREPGAMRAAAPVPAESAAAVLPPSPAPLRPSPALPQPAAAPVEPPAAVQPQPQPPAPVLVPVTGQVLDGNGRPAPGVVVIARRHVGGLEAVFTAFTAVFTLGLACLAGICDSSEVRAVTGRDGRFRLLLAQGSEVGRPGDHDLVAAVPGPQPKVPLLTTSTRWNHTGAAQDLGVVRLWRPQLAVRRTGGQVRTDFTRLRDEYGSDARYTLTFSDSTGASAYQLSDVEPGQEVDGRVVEQGITGAQVSASAKDRSSKRREYLPAPVGVPAGPMPLSRGRTCSRYGSNGGRVAIAGCPYTDGRLGAEVGPAASPQGSCPDETAPGCKETFGAVLVDLGTSRRVSLVVLRGCTFDCSVQTSTDGRTFTASTTTEFGHDDDVALKLEPRTARYVRVIYSFSIDLSTSREISVF